jgi:hypothetical protein
VAIGDVVLLFSEDDDEMCIAPTKRYVPPRGPSSFSSTSLAPFRCFYLINF